jgi:GH18 family chitinase
MQDYTINHYIKLGADRDKLVLGIPTYGRSYTLYNPLATEIGSPADGPGEQGDATREKGYLAYYEVFPLVWSYSFLFIITLIAAQVLITSAERDF